MLCTYLSLKVGCSRPHLKLEAISRSCAVTYVNQYYQHISHMNFCSVSDSSTTYCRVFRYYVVLYHQYIDSLYKKALKSGTFVIGNYAQK